MNEIFTIELDGAIVGVYDNVELARKELVGNSEELRNRAYGIACEEAYNEYMMFDGFNGGSYPVIFSISKWDINTWNRQTLYEVPFNFVFDEYCEYVSYNIKEE